MHACVTLATEIRGTAFGHDQRPVRKVSFGPKQQAWQSPRETTLKSSPALPAYTAKLQDDHIVVSGSIIALRGCNWIHYTPRHDTSAEIWSTLKWMFASTSHTGVQVWVLVNSLRQNAMSIINDFHKIMSAAKAWVHVWDGVHVANKCILTGAFCEGVSGMPMLA